MIAIDKICDLIKLFSACIPILAMFCLVKISNNSRNARFRARELNSLDILDPGATGTITLSKYCDSVRPDRRAAEIVRCLTDARTKLKQGEVFNLGINDNNSNAKIDEVQFDGILRVSKINDLSIDWNGIKNIFFSNTYVRKTNIRVPNDVTIKFDNCILKDVYLSPENRGLSAGSIIFHDCWINQILIGEHALRNMEIKGGGIFSINCPPPGATNPFTGSVILSDVFFPRTKRGFPISGSQPYRNLRSHLRSLENAPAAGTVHAAELALEREEDDSFWNKLFNHGYELISDYGNASVRPLFWTLALFATSALFALIFDGAELARDASEYKGWETILVGDAFQDRFARAIVLGFQPILNPVGIFGLKALLVAKSLALQLWLVAQGILTPVFVAMFILGLRRRFKMG